MTRQLSKTETSPLRLRQPVWLVLWLMVLVLCLALAVLTRPVVESGRVYEMEELQATLIPKHEGPQACVRWQEHALSPAQRQAFLQDWERHFPADLHTLLPFMARLRLANLQAESQAHTHTARQEALGATMDKHSWWERTRMSIRRDEITNTLPWLERVTEDPQQTTLDKHRAARLDPYLRAEDQKTMDKLVARWRIPLSSPQVQRDMLDHVARRLTQIRLDALQVALRTWHAHYGRYPVTFAPLVSYMRNTGQFTSSMQRSITADGSLSDGWLRPLAYYARGTQDYVLVSEGLSDSTDQDDLVRGP